MENYGLFLFMGNAGFISSTVGVHFAVLPVFSVLKTPGRISRK